MEVRNVHTLGDVKFWGGWSLVGSVGRGQGACACFDLLQAWVHALAQYLVFLFVFPLPEEAQDGGMLHCNLGQAASHL